MDPFALPCHPTLRIDLEDRDWRAIGVKSTDDVRRKSTRCPQCKTVYTAFVRRFGDEALTVEWVRPTPFRVTAQALDDRSTPVWQDAAAGVAPSEAAVADGAAQWEGAVQLCAPVGVLTAAGEVFAQPGDLLLERREKWNAQDRRLALLWSPRLGRPVVAWHGFARLLQADA